MQRGAGLATLGVDEATRPLQSDRAQQPQSPIAQPLAAVCMLEPSMPPQYEDLDKQHDAPPPRYSDITLCSSKSSTSDDNADFAINQYSENTPFNYSASGNV